MLWMGKSFDPQHQGDELYLKMDGHKLYEYALKTVPLVVKESLEKAGLPISEIKEGPDPPGQRKNGRGDPEAPVQNHAAAKYKPEVMPMTISWLGNSSVATVPTLLDLILEGQNGRP